MILLFSSHAALIVWTSRRTSHLKTCERSFWWRWKTPKASRASTKEIPLYPCDNATDEQRHVQHTRTHVYTHIYTLSSCHCTARSQQSQVFDVSTVYACNLSSWNDIGCEPVLTPNSPAVSHKSCSLLTCFISKSSSEAVATFILIVN